MEGAASYCQKPKVAKTQPIDLPYIVFSRLFVLKITNSLQTGDKLSTTLKVLRVRKCLPSTMFCVILLKGIIKT